jgi:peptidoglycan/xylan/chitin deacetylase (PgdA/CDA1 family)
MVRNDHLNGNYSTPPSESKKSSHKDRTNRPLAILTYHRIVKDEADWRFHDVRRASFEQQMQRVQNLESANPRKNAPVIVTFDDGTKDHIQAAEILTERGLSGVFFIITGKMDSSGYLSHQEVRHISDLGHSIGSHTVTHPQLPTLSDTELEVELKTSQEILEQLTGKKIQWMAPPGGAIDKRSLDVAIASGYRIVRTMDWGYARTLSGQVPTIPIFKWTNVGKFERIVTGRSSFLQYRLKQTIKRTLGLNAYVAFRNGIARQWSKS